MSEKKEKRKSALFGRGSSKSGSKGKDSKPTEEPQVVVGDADATTTPEVPKQSEKEKKSKRKSVSSLLPKNSSDSEESSKESGRKRVWPITSPLLTPCQSSSKSKGDEQAVFTDLLNLVETKKQEVVKLEQQVSDQNAEIEKVQRQQTNANILLLGYCLIVT